MSVIVKDKYSAVWVSHSSISDYLRCPRAYYLKNVYRDPKTNHKISIMQPGLALGQVVHDVLEEISGLPVDDRLRISLLDRFNNKWKNVTGQKGGFFNQDEEEIYKKRGEKMLTNVMDNPGPILRKAIKLRQDLPNFWLSDEDNIILCGKIDWLEYDEKSDSVKIIDFKTGKFDEDSESLQLPIYQLLALNVQNRPVTGVQYWYIERDTEPIESKLPNIDKSKEIILDIARRIALARKMERFTCKNKDGCLHCRPYENIISGKADFIGIDGYKQDIYILKRQQ